MRIAMARRLAVSFVLGETRDVHWTPLLTERMTLLPTWTPQDRATNETADRSAAGATG
jgi:hypothetical protein